MKYITVDDYGVVRLSHDKSVFAVQFCPTCFKQVHADTMLWCKCVHCRTKDGDWDVLEILGWSYEHPGYWCKYFTTDKDLVVITGSEHRFDFFTVEDYEGGHEAFEMVDFCDFSSELELRFNFTSGELYTIKNVIETEDRASRNNFWHASYGSLTEPNGVHMWHTDNSNWDLRIDADNIISGDVNKPGKAQDDWITFCAIIMALLGDMDR